MTIQTKAINLASFAIVISSVFAGSKCAQYNIMKNSNDELIEKVNKVTIEAKMKWDKNAQLLNNRIEQLRGTIELYENSENQRIQDKLESEKALLHENYEKAIMEKSSQIESEMLKFQTDLNQKLGTAESVLSKLHTRLNNYFEIREKQKELETLSRMIIEDEIEGQFDNCYSLKVLRNEFKDILPVLRKYYILNYDKISTFKYFFAGALTKLMFNGAPMEKFDLLSELSSSVENGDIHKALFLFNSLRGWPRLILKDWAEKCRLRSEFIQRVKSELYLNKL